MTSTIFSCHSSRCRLRRLEEGLRRLRPDPSRARRTRPPGAALDENPNDVIVTHTFDSPEAAKAFFAMPELKEAMSRAGVDADSVQISYFDEVEAGTLVGV